MLMGSPGCFAYRAWLVTRKEEQEHSDGDFNTPEPLSPTQPWSTLIPWKLLAELTMITGQLSKAVQTPLASSQSAQQMKMGGSQPCCTGISCPLHARRCPWERGHAPFPGLSHKGRCALSATLRRGSGTDKGRVLWDLAPLPAASHSVSFPGTGSLISSIGFNSSAGSGNVIFNTLEGSLSRRCLFHHLCPSGAHFKLAKHRLLGKQ